MSTQFQGMLTATASEGHGAAAGFLNLHPARGLDQMLRVRAKEREIEKSNRQRGEREPKVYGYERKVEQESSRETARTGQSNKKTFTQSHIQTKWISICL